MRVFVVKLWLLCLLLFGVQAVQAQELGRITGTVVEARGGQPLPGVMVVAVGTLYAAVTDAGGQFVLGPLPAGTYNIEVNALGFRAERQAVAVTAGIDQEQAFRLHPPEVEVARVEAAALERALRPVDGVAVPRLGALNAHTAAAVLRAVPGVGASRRGMLDVEPVVRGLWGNQVGVYVDGVRLLAGSPFGFGAPLSLFDPHTLLRVEVVKGPYALTWGGGNLSALRVTTRGAVPPGTRLRSGFQVGYTSKLRALDATGVLAGAPGKVSYRLHGAYRSGDDYKDGSGRAVPADFQTIALRGQGAYQFTPSTRVVVHAGYQDRRDLDAPTHVLAAATAEAADLAARFQTAWAVGPIRALDATVSWNRRAQRLVDPVGVQGSGQLRALDAAQTQLGARFAARLVPIRGWAVEVGGDVYSDLHDATRQVAERMARNEPVTVLQDARITSGGVFAQGTRTFGRVEATGTVRLDVVRARAAVSPQANSLDTRVTETNVSAALALTTELTAAVQASVGIGSVVRSAGAYERYAVAAPFPRASAIAEVVGMLGLAPERSTQADLWLRADTRRLDLHLNAFVRRLDDFITVAAIAEDFEPPLAVPVTYGYANHQATFYGAEALLAYAVLGEFVTANLGASYLWGHNDTLDEPAFGVAPPTVMLGGRLEAPANLFFFEAVLRGAFEQTRVAALRGETPYGGYVAADLRFGITLPRSASLLIGLDNLTGRAYADPLNALQRRVATRLPEPGRVFYIRLRYGI